MSNDAWGFVKDLLACRESAGDDDDGRAKPESFCCSKWPRPHQRCALPVSVRAIAAALAVTGHSSTKAPTASALSRAPSARLDWPVHR